ncbi:pickpocket protein 28-like [Melitaea cinxia]|uniref:pickpocket protein 28-like n=1 Tax=Melitaea cinxia TaxID=113334 RepID=UPI001E27184C|nr:pickpocket protein 28-like [Melitaea cinxia]
MIANLDTECKKTSLSHNVSFNLQFLKILNITTKKARNKRKCDKNGLYKKQELIKYLKTELLTSTTHGVPYFVKDNIHYLEKLFWVGSFIICVVLAILLLNLQFLRFIAAPTVMSVEMNYFDWNISYPAITLCPLYKSDVPSFKLNIMKTYNETGLSIEGYLWAISQAALDTLEYMDLSAPDDVVALIHPKEYATTAALLFRKFQNTWLATNTNWSITVDAAMTEMGMCHVINSNVAIYDEPHYLPDFVFSSSWKTATAATHVKKNIELSIFEADFFTEIKNYSNVYKVFIHSPEEVTTSTTSSFGVDVEGIIEFGLSVWSSRISDALRYMPRFLRKCRFSHEPISERYPIYSHSHCMMECRIKLIKKLCGCLPHFYKPLDHERICYISELKCVLKHRREIVTLQISKETLQKFNYDKDLPRISRDSACLSTCDLDLYYKDKEDFEPKKGLNILEIKITSFPKVRVLRDIIFDIYDIVLRSGGVINLCIGSSIISIMEIIIAILKYCVYFLIKILQSMENRVLTMFYKMKK